MLTTKEKQRNFFKSIYTLSKKAKKINTMDGERVIISLVIPVECIEEIKEWSEEE